MEHLSFSILIILGIGVWGGLVGAIIFQKLKIPQVIGYLVVGLILGRSGFNLITEESLDSLRLFNFFAIGIIGFLVGGEIKVETFRRHAKSYLWILIGEGGLAFILVIGMSFLLFFYLLQSVLLAAACSLILGAIASATDPASTIEVLWEYRSRGPLTSAIIAIIALDDALAMFLYACGCVGVKLLTQEMFSFVDVFKHFIFELFGALILGVIAGVILKWILKFIPFPERGMAMAIALILLVLATTLQFNLDMILSSMMMGFVLVNLAPQRSLRVFEVLKSFSLPIYIIFFVLVGARIHIQSMPLWGWYIVLVYLVGRTLGKIIGTWWGGKWSGAEKVIRNYLGISLFAQGGVAISLSILATQSLNDVMVTTTMSLGNLIITVITATTFIMQLIGPLLVKLAITKANERNKNRTEKDLLQEISLTDLLDDQAITLTRELTITQAVKRIRDLEQTAFPVVDPQNRLIGIFRLSDLREIITETEEWDWLLLVDVLRYHKRFISTSMNGWEAYNELLQTGFEELPLCKSDGTVMGVISLRKIRKILQQSLLTSERSSTLQWSNSHPA